MSLYEQQIASLRAYEVENESLRAQIAELKAENERLRLQWAGCSQQLKDACDDLSKVEEECALLAELRKDAAPVIASEQKPVAWVDVIDRHEGPYNFNGLELLDSGKHLLFTSPPNTADIEQRVAEACEKLCVENHGKGDDAACCAYDIREGKWREYL